MGADTRKVEEGLLTEFLLTVFLTVGDFRGVKPVKNPVNTGENELEPVVGIEPTTYGLRMQSIAFLKTLKKLSKCPSNGRFVHVDPKS